MASGNVVEVIARVKADVSAAQQSFKALGDQFKNLKLGEGLTRNLEADFKNLEKSFSNYFEKLDVGATGKASVKELNDITSASQNLDKAIARLLADWEKIGEKDLRRSLDLSGLEEDRKEIDDLANSLDTKLKTAMTALKEGGKNLNAAGLRDYGKALSDAAKAIKEGDLDAAGQKYNEVYEGLAKKIEEVNQEIKDTQNNAAKQQENLAGARANIKMYEDIRRAVNDAYGSDARKQIEETMAAIQTSMGKGGVGGLGQKLQDKFGNLPEIQGQLKNFISMLQQPWKGNNIEEIGKQFTDLRDKIREVGGDSLARSFSQLIGPSTQANLKSQVESMKKDIQSLLPTFQQVSNSLSQGQIKDKFDQMVSSVAQGDIGALSNYMNTLGDAIAKVQKQIQAGGSDTTALEKELEILKNVQTAIGNAFGANSQQYISETSQKLKEFRESLDDKQKAIFDQLASSMQRLGENGQRAGEQVKTANEGLRESANAAAKSKSELEQVIQSFARFTTLAGIMDIFRNSIRAAFNAVKELDEAMNSIAVVTDMTTQDLWDQIDVYTQMANATGSTIAGAYQVAQLYYQQGLSTNDVMAATTETLKLARVAAIDYASATDYMTSAVKGFGLSYQDLSHIMDVYSNLAAKTAADTEEISIAMSKVASIAHSTGMELETTAGFLTQIIATTREAPETAGTSLKTVVARFAEVKKLVSQGVDTGTDEEGTEIDVNKIETALRLAGVALRDSQGQMRDLDDVFIELSSHWNELDTLTQRYIATQAAGSRQQSRFLAMISDYDSLMETLGYATDAAGANNEQFGKTLDSLESKLNGLQNAWTEFTTGIANQSVIKGAVDILTTLLGLVNDLTGVFGNFGGAIAKTMVLWGGLKLGGSVIGTIANSVLGLDLKTKSLSSTFNSLLIPSIIKSIALGKTAAAATEMHATIVAAEAAAHTADTVALDAETKAKYANAMATSTLSKALLKMAAALGISVPLLLAIIAAVGAVVYGIYRLATASKRAQKNFSEYSEEMKSFNDEIDETSQKLKDLQDISENGYIAFNDKGAKEYSLTLNELVAGTDELNNRVSLSSEEYQGYQDILQRLVDMGFASSIDDANKALHQSAQETGDATEVLKQYNEELLRQMQYEARINKQNYFNNKDGIRKDSQTALRNAAFQTQYDLAAEAYDVNDTIKSLLEAGKLSDLQTDSNYQGILQKILSGDATAEDIQNDFQKYNEIIKYIKTMNIDDFSDDEITGVNNIIEAWREYSEALQQVENANYDFQITYSDFLSNLVTNLTNSEDSLLNSGVDLTGLAETIVQKQMGDFDGSIQAFIAQLSNKEIGEIEDSIRIAFEELAELDFFNDSNVQALTTLLNEGASKFKTYADYYQAVITKIEEIINSKIGQALLNIIPGFDSDFLSSMFGIQNLEQQFQNFSQGAGGGNASYLTGKGFDSDETMQIVNGLTNDARNAVISGKVNLGDLFELGTLPDTVEEATEKIQELIDAQNDFKKAEPTDADYKWARKLAKATDEVKESYDDLEMPDWDDQIDETKKLSKEYGDVVDYFDELNEAADDNISALAENTDAREALASATDSVAGAIGWSTEALAQEWLACNGDTEAFINLQAQKLAAIMTYYTGDTGGLTADQMAAWSAGDAWAYAARMKAMYGEGHALTQAAVAYASSITSMRGGYGGGGGSGGGGGGSEKENNATFGQDPFYNYIKTVDQYTHSLEALERELDILSDKDAVRDNLSAQEEEYKRVIGANQSYLNEVNRQLGYMQEEGMEKWGAYLDFAEDGSLRLNEAYFNLTGDTVEELDDWIDAYDDLLGRQTDLNEELDDYKKELKDLWEGWRDDYIDILEQLTDILQREDEKALEEKEKFYEKLEQQSQDYLDAVRKNIEAERDARDKANSYEDLSKKQKRLSLLQRDTSGRYSSEIQSLQEEIANAQQELADQQVDDMLQQLEDQMDADERRHSETLDMMQKQIDEYVETRAYIKEAEEIIAQGDEAILAKLMQGEDYLQASDAERQKMLDEWGPQIGSLNKYVEYLGEGIVTATQYIAKMMTDGLTQATAAVVQAVGSISPTVVVNIGGGGGGGGDGPGGGPSGPSQSTTCRAACGNNCTARCMSDCSEACAASCVTYCEGGCRTRCDGECKGSCKGVCSGRASNPARRYASGGMVDYTGPAWVDGTRSKPEAFLNANQTSLIGSFAKSLERLSGTTSGSTFQGIGDCTIDITIGSIGKDYDIDQAIAKVKDEIVRSTEYRNVNILKRGR